MNNKYQDKAHKGRLSKRVDSFYSEDDGKTFFAEYDGFHFEGSTIKAVMNKILKYIFSGGEE